VLRHTRCFRMGLKRGPQPMEKRAKKGALPEEGFSRPPDHYPENSRFLPRTPGRVSTSTSRSKVHPIRKGVCGPKARPSAFSHKNRRR